MAYSEQLADRIRDILEPLLDAQGHALREINMFGGLCFMVRGHMCCGVVGGTLMLRLGADGAAEALQQEHTRPMDFTGAPMKTMVYVDPPGLRTKALLRRWLDRGLEFNGTLRAK
ncbi:MAG: TfoX/Sxy family protein [Phycisphaeraceae bacterium]|nr:TfoX/Sxy family protein [Phycisphaeraceae bacterium]